VTPGKTIEQLGVRKAEEKTQEFDLKREKMTFEEERKEFRRDQASSSKAQLEVRECGIPLAFDRSALPGEEKR
jgi:hypothetical protein